MIYTKYETVPLRVFEVFKPVPVSSHEFIKDYLSRTGLKGFEFVFVRDVI